MVKDKSFKERYDRETRNRQRHLGTTQNSLQWHGHVLQKENNDWVNKCMKWTVLYPEVDQRGLGKRLCKKTVKHAD